MPWLGLFGGVLFEAVTVGGATTCPSPSDVAAKVSPLVHSSGGPADTAEIARRGDTVFVSLARADGRPIGTQALEGAACADLADAAAVILASWENDESRREGLSMSRAPVRDVVVRTETSSKGSTGRTWDVAVGVGGALADQNVSPSAFASGSVAPGGGTFGLRAGLGFAGFGTASLPDGRVHWERFMLGGGPKLTWTMSSIDAEAHLGAYLGWVTSRGEGFRDNRDDDGFEVSLWASVRLGGVGPGFRPWVEGAVAFWPSPVVAYELPAGNETRLPAVAGLALAGVRLGR